MRARWVIAVGLLALALGCSDPGPEDAGELRVGLIATMSGELFRYGHDAMEAARFAVREANDQGGVPLGPGVNAPRARVRLYTEDSRHDPEAAIQAAQRLLDKDRVSAVIGPAFSSLADEVARQAQKQRVPMITPFATLNNLTRGRDFVFRIPDPNAAQGRALACYAANTLNANSAAVLYDASNVYSEELDSVFTESFTAQGGRLTANTAYGAGERSFRGPLKTILAGDPDVVFLPNTYKAVMMQVSLLRRLGYDKTILGGDSWKGREIEGLPEFENTVFIDHWFRGMPTPGNREFTAAYERELRHPPTEMAALTYDAFGALFTAARAARSTDPEAIATALVSMDAYAGVTGTLDFTKEGDPVSEIFLVRLENGRETLLTRLGPGELEGEGT